MTCTINLSVHWHPQFGKWTTSKRENNRKVKKGMAERKRNKQRVRQEIMDRDMDEEEPELDEEEDDKEGYSLKLNK